MAGSLLASGRGECTLTFSLAPRWLPATYGADKRESLWLGRVGRFQELLIIVRLSLPGTAVL